MQRFKEWWQKLASKTKKQLLILVGGTVVLALVITAIVFLNKDNSYSVLFTSMNQSEAAQVANLLQDSDISFRYNESTGTISVPTSAVDQTRANLLSQGYPKSGFSYDMYIDHAGLMSTESDRKQYSLYDLQNRLGETIRLFDGVQDATVTINQEKESTYALGDDSASEASASAVVTMENGRTLSPEGADAIRRLISTSVKGMTFTNISVFDAATMQEVGSGGGTGTTAAANDLTELTSLIESNIASNIRTILEKIYGRGKVEVAVKGTVDMATLLQESTTYSTPEKIDDEDKTGLIERETLAGDSETDETTADGGVAGADGNAETPRYEWENGDGTGSAYNYSHVDRQYLYNMVKEQRQVDPGVLQNATVSVVIDTDDMSVADAELRSLVANASGISAEDAANNITIIRTLSAESKAQAGEDSVQTVQPGPGEGGGLPLPILIAIIAGGVLLFLILLLLLLRRKKKKKKAKEEEELLAMPADALGAAAGDGWSEGEAPSAAVASILEEEEETSQNEEIIKLKMQRNMKLKQNIGEMVDQNPQIVAKLVQGWLTSEEGGRNGGGRSSDKHK